MCMFKANNILVLFLYISCHGVHSRTSDSLLTHWITPSVCYPLCLLPPVSVTPCVCYPLCLLAPMSVNQSVVSSTKISTISII